MSSNREGDPTERGQPATGPVVDRRTVIQGTGATIAAAAILKHVNPVMAQTKDPVKIGFIEDYSGNLSVYGLQKLHAVQLAVKEINEGKTLKGGPVSAGGLGAMAQYAAKPPVIGK